MSADIATTECTAAGEARWRMLATPLELPFHPGVEGFLAGLKTTDYLTALLGKKMARERGAFEGIHQTRGGEILEGTTSNVFLLRGGRLETPPLSRGILAGITRERVLTLAHSAGLRPRESA